MSFIDDILISDASAFVDPDFMPGVESVVYVKPDNTERTINAQVFRDGTKDLPGGVSGVSPSIEIAVVNSATTGIDAAEIKQNDRVKVNAKLDGQMVSLALIRPANDGKWRIDGGMLRLGLR